MPGPDPQPPLSGPALLGFGISLAGAVLLPLLIGLAVDGHFGTGPGGVAAGLLLGIVAACCVVYLRFKQYW